MNREDYSPLPVDFYERESHELARSLLGTLLVRDAREGLTVARIVEVEVYGGVEDAASHANSGRPTERTRAMFGEPGTAYVYRSYGIHHCLNIVAPAKSHASAVLVRAAEPVYGAELMHRRRGLRGELTPAMLPRLMSGPGKLTQALAIDRRFDGLELTGGELFVAERDLELDDERIAAAPRIGLNPKTVGDSHEWPWRYAVRGSRHLSRKIPKAST